ncbi:MAG: hypothetical protein ABIH86_01920 [Planctomycetota bacterium]
MNSKPANNEPDSLLCCPMLRLVRIGFALLSIIIACRVATGIAAESSVTTLVDETQSGADILVDVAPDWNGVCRKGRRVSVQIILYAGDQFPSSPVDLGLTTESGAGDWIERVVLQPNVRRIFRLETLLSEAPLFVELSRPGGKTVERERLFRAPLISVLKPLMTDERLIAIASTDDSGLSVLKHQLSEINPKSRFVSIVPENIPVTWTAYDTVDLLIVRPSTAGSAPVFSPAVSTFVNSGGIALVVSTDSPSQSIPLGLGWACVVPADEQGGLIALTLRARTAVNRKLLRLIDDLPPDVDRDAYFAFDGLYQRMPDAELQPARQIILIIAILSSAASAFVILRLRKPARRSARSAMLASVCGVSLVLSIALLLLTSESDPGASEFSVLYIPFDTAAPSGDLQLAEDIHTDAPTRRPLETWTLLNVRTPRTADISSRYENAALQPISEDVAERLALSVRSNRRADGSELIRDYPVMARPSQPLVYSFAPATNNERPLPSRSPALLVLPEYDETTGSDAYRLPADMADIFARTQVGFLEIIESGAKRNLIIRGKSLDAIDRMDVIGSLSIADVEAMTSSASAPGMSKSMIEFVIKRSAQRLLPPRLILWERKADSALLLDGQTLPLEPGWQFYIAELEAAAQ